MKKEAEDYKVYLKKNLPARLHYGSKDDTYSRVGDILLLTDAPKVFHFSKRKPSPGTHGYDPAEVKDMHATFYAWGPAFKKNKKIQTFQNIHIYPVVAEILGLEYYHRIDGNKKLAKEILQ